MTAPTIALSLKQPWAALVIAGRKSVEIRSWSTDRTGPILIHASKSSEPRTAAWSWVDDDLRPLTRLLGGVIGSVVITGCVRYESPGSFLCDRHLHLNEPDRFRPPVMYGLTLTGPRLLEFRPVIGNVKFFSVS
jgi:hypothetical protein